MKLQELRGVGEWEPAVIVGNGLSLNKIPLERLSPIPTFAVNMIGNIFRRTDWRPTYYTVVTDGFFVKEFQPHFYQAVADAKVAFVGDHNRSYFNGRSQDNIIWLCCRHDGPWQDYEAQDDWWSDDPSSWVSRWGTSSIVSLQLAAYMGYNPLILIGFDLGYRPLLPDGTSPMHFDPNYLGDYFRNRDDGYDFDETERAHVRAHQIADVNLKRLGVQVFNGTIGGKLEQYIRIDIFEWMKHALP